MRELSAMGTGTEKELMIILNSDASIGSKVTYPAPILCALVVCTLPNLLPSPSPTVGTL